MARAAYSMADVYILDDPLSALDPEVAEKVFNECILGLLKGKTRLLVTNQLQCLPRCDSIIALGKRGKVLEQGKYDDLINDSNGEVTRLLKGVAPSRRNIVKEDKHHEEAPYKDNKTILDKKNQNLMTKEERQTGTVKLSVYLKYIQAGGGYIPFSVVFITYLMSTGTNVASAIWVSIWTADTGYEKQTETFYIVGYAISSVLMGVMAFVRSYGLGELMQYPKSRNLLSRLDPHPILLPQHHLV